LVFASVRGNADGNPLPMRNFGCILVGLNRPLPGRSGGSKTKRIASPASTGACSPVGTDAIAGRMGLETSIVAVLVAESGQRFAL
jgi:hypothetical protein